MRLIHGLTVLSFAGAWLTAQSEGWRLMHLTLGYTTAALVVLRIVWGLIGPRHSRFSSAFMRAPVAAMRQLGRLVRGHLADEPDAGVVPGAAPGHKPAGAATILGLLALALAVAATGWATFHDPGGNGLALAHELAAETMLALVALQLPGVLLDSWLLRENLIGAKFWGRKAGRQTALSGPGAASPR